MAGRPPAARRSPEHAWLITGPLAIFAVVLAVVLGVLDGPPGEWGWAALVLGLALLGDTPLLFYVVRRQTTAITFIEIPLLFGLYLLPPLTVVLVFTLGSLITQIYRRFPPAKLWFNVAKSAAAVSLASLVVLALPEMHGFGPSTWGVLVAAVATHALVTLGAVAGVFAIMHGAQAGWEVFRTSGPGLLTVMLNVALGLVIVICLRVTPWSALLLLALAAALLLLYRSYAQFFRQHRTLADVYELTKAMSERGQDGTLADSLLGRVRALMQAEYATLWLPAQGRHPEVLLTARVEDSGLLDFSRTPLIARERATGESRTVAAGSRMGGHPDVREALREAGLKDVIVTPLRSGQAVIGSLEVVNRLADIGHFTPADVPVFETIAAHAAVALENSRLVDRLRHDAYHDGLTNLPNRRRVTGALEEAVRVRAPNEVVALLLFDVAGLRQVNESVGHAAGDRVLVEVANRLRSSAPSAALVGRVGSDEFVVTLRMESIDAALDLAAELREQIRDRMVFDVLVLDVDTVVGVAVHPDHGDDPATLLQRADLAVTRAKSAPDGIQLFSPGLESRSSRRLGLAGDLRRALDHAEVEVYYQPKVTLTDRRLVGVECLARWVHPAHGTVAPEDFVAVAEHTGQLPELTRLVLGEALRRSRDWTSGGNTLAVSVNISPRTLADQQFPALVQGMLAEYGVAPELLTLEIKEAGVLDGTERAVPGLRRLRDVGVRLAVDDFGTGHSSLSYLRRLPVNEVKVDRSFVQGMATDPVDLAIVNAVVTLSQQFGLAVVAEGVESELTLELLQDIGCQIGQGFLFSRPLPYERLEAWFAAQSESDTSAGPADVRRLRAVP
ncbi:MULTISPECIES: bifunctional diguanylate cyclase/phosphodiesterase [unclassified Plantactinospora]|uniref:putative bifunctional diguanylate cyclase/phosphodiesterase n=1 Tax=unclassified Plantactinospora TaxID=2631981 RepID=UPI000D168D05|nr:MULTISPECIES: EAL domain-containing protein [unclassified Plantactinospora]AVT32442.1 diguanylate cyclase [Plantactinospora sp. BC1]AVT39121.1 diguanylate cyclase [Plantactinospora sp. BB1]